MSKGGYKDRDGVDWYDESMGMPKHGQMHRVTKKYYNEFKEEWCSKRSKKVLLDKSKLVLFDFKFYSISNIKKDYELDYEKVAMFITRLYLMHYRGYKVDDWKFIYWTYDDLVTFLGVNWIYILEKLNDDGIVIYKEVKLKRDPTKMLKYFMLNKRVVLEQGDVYQEVYLRDAAYEQRIIRFYKSLTRARTGIAKAIEKTMDKTELVIKTDIDKLIESIWDEKQIEDDALLANEYTSNKILSKIKRRRKDLAKSKIEYKGILKRYYTYLCRVQACDSIDEKRALYGINADTFGLRISHMFSNAPRKYRKHLTIDGESVVEIDIKSSQPSFLHALFIKWVDIEYADRFKAIPPNLFIDKMRMLAGNKRLDLYKYMAMKVKGIAKIGDNTSREVMKKLFCSIVLGDPIYKLKGQDKRQLVDELFGYGFYEFLTELAKLDFGLEVKRKANNMVALLQREESAFLNSVMQKLVDDGVCFLPLYDSLIVKSSDADAVKTAFRTAILEQKLTGIIQLK
jgi:hypothetical protein